VQREVGQWNGIYASSGCDSGSNSIVNSRRKPCDEVHTDAIIFRDFEHSSTVLSDGIDERFVSPTLNLKRRPDVPL